MTSTGRKRGLRHLCEVLPRHLGNTDSHSRVHCPAGRLSFETPQNRYEQYNRPDGHSGGSQRGVEVRWLKAYHFCINCQGYGLYLFDSLA